MSLLKVVVIAIACLPGIAGATETPCMRAYRDVLALPPEERVQVTDAMNLEDLISLTECGYAHGHPTLYFLDEDLARRGAAAVPSILNRLSSAKHRQVIFGFLAVLRDISRAGLYDVAHDDNAASTIRAAVDRMEKPRDPAEKLLQQMGIAGVTREPCILAYDELWELPKAERARVADAMDLEALISLAECGYAHGHVTVNVLRSDLARRGAAVVPGILNRLSSGTDPNVIDGFLLVLRDISRAGQYDFASDDKAASIITAAVKRMPEPRHGAEELLRQMGLQCPPGNAAGPGATTLNVPVGTKRCGAGVYR